MLLYLYNSSKANLIEMQIFRGLFNVNSLKKTVNIQSINLIKLFILQ